jgi:hypothetical protein
MAFIGKNAIELGNGDDPTRPRCKAGYNRSEIWRRSHQANGSTSIVDVILEFYVGSLFLVARSVTSGNSYY